VRKSKVIHVQYVYGMYVTNKMSFDMFHSFQNDHHTFLIHKRFPFMEEVNRVIHWAWTGKVYHHGIFREHYGFQAF